MIIKSEVNTNHPEEISYDFIVSTDSSVEADIIKKYLAKAQDECRQRLRKNTKVAPAAHVVCAIKHGSTRDLARLKTVWPHTICGNCTNVIFYELPENNEFFSVTCPSCEFKKIMMKGE